MIDLGIVDPDVQSSVIAAYLETVKKATRQDWGKKLRGEEVSSWKPLEPSKEKNELKVAEVQQRSVNVPPGLIFWAAHFDVLISDLAVARGLRPFGFEVVGGEFLAVAEHKGALMAANELRDGRVFAAHRGRDEPLCAFRKVGNHRGHVGHIAAVVLEEYAAGTNHAGREPQSRGQ